MQITIKIQRYNPDIDDAPHYQEYSVEIDPNARLLDALMDIKRFQDGSLGFRKSCAHGVCGSDAMRINGQDGLACKTLVKDVAVNDGDTVVVEPLRYLPVQRDLIVDQSEFFAKYKAIKPYLINDEEVAEKERIQSPEERLVFDDSTNCILCASCYSACPVSEEHPSFIGPAAIAQAFRFLADSRDKGAEERLLVLDAEDGVWPCQNHFKCTQACPRSILITKRINQTKRMIKDWKGEK
ncbi:MAG: succinate dehydrogenase iron-sulfur subunit [Desulfofustis sp.]|nr:succinate dehydrogenase iron-sulfur subunit [Desulfofustis sp.]MBT8344779.1 succinate dehydrogenase iron-sulfur subunit [Desulfofustis sp.]NNF47613.1 succinate dehydrogenase iron-sulfur subunit [Desulfofustis sp.]NNK57810.1 succinate dehydrogenase iron-sulfur subunit [Desulfofustis sp.]